MASFLLYTLSNEIFDKTDRTGEGTKNRERGPRGSSSSTGSLSIPWTWDGVVGVLRGNHSNFLQLWILVRFYRNESISPRALGLKVGGEERVVPLEHGSNHGITRLLRGGVVVAKLQVTAADVRS
jgi:hypothetical protein